MPEPTAPCTGLLLTGGGARAAYQVGVLRAIGRLRREAGDTALPSPYQVIVGTSAGGILAAALASSADDIDKALGRLSVVWEQMHADRVYRTDSFGVVRTGARWLTMMSMGWALARMRRLKPRSLLDNSPLHGLLSEVIKLDRIPRLMAEGHLQALAVSASSYTSGQHVTFYDSAQPVAPWERSNRLAVPGAIAQAHLLASAAIPFIFPAVDLPLGRGSEWFGDGSMRQAAPVSPAVHLGADRILVIGAGRMHEPPGSRAAVPQGYPSVAQIAGHALSSIFLDALAVDVERLQRINRTLSLVPPEQRTGTGLRPIDVLLISPSERLDDLAAKHIEALPLSIRALLKAIGVSGASSRVGASGAALASYLLFEADYTRELMALGERDTLARRGDVQRFFGWPVTDSAD